MIRLSSRVISLIYVALLKALINTLKKDLLTRKDLFLYRGIIVWLEGVVEPPPGKMGWPATPYGVVQRGVFFLSFFFIFYF